jgi:hypothetical protein
LFALEAYDLWRTALAEHIAKTHGLDGSSLEGNRVLGNVSDPKVQARYAAQALQRQHPGRDGKDDR